MQMLSKDMPLWMLYPDGELWWSTHVRILQQPRYTNDSFQFYLVKGQIQLTDGFYYRDLDTVKTASLDALFDFCPPTDQVLTVQDVANLLKVTRHTVQRRIDKGQLVGFKINDTRRVLRSTLVNLYPSLFPGDTRGTA